MPPMILAGLSLVQMLLASHSLSKAGATQPSSLSNALSKLIALLGQGEIQNPNDLHNILGDLVAAEDVASALLPPDVAAQLGTIGGLLKKSRASMINLESGQVAEVAAITMSFGGKSVPVDVFAIRRDSKTNVATDLGLSAQGD